MTDFAAAQSRILARRAASAATAASAASTLHQTRQTQLLSLPPALRVLAHGGFNLFSTLQSPTDTRPAFRVGQVDAELLDEELLELLRAQAGEGLRLFGSHLGEEWSAEIKGLLRLITWKLSIWDHGASYGASLQGLRYADARREGGVAAPSQWQKVAYGLLTVGGRYAWTRWEGFLAAAGDGYEEPSALIKKLSRVTGLVDTAHNVAAFVSFTVFLYNGRYRTLIDRLLRLRLIPTGSNVGREVSFEYLNRQLVWHAFTEFLLFLLPLVGISRWRRWLARGWKKAKASLTRLRSGDDTTDDADEKRGELSFLPERTCAICYEDQNPAGGRSEQDVISAGANAGIVGNASTDVTNPYETFPCGCVYCFVCLAQRIEGEDGEGWTCLRCGELVKRCRPWSGDVVIVEEKMEGERPGSGTGSGKSVAWADEVVEAKLDEVEEEEGMREVEPMPVEEDEGFASSEEGGWGDERKPEG